MKTVEINSRNFRYAGPVLLFLVPSLVGLALFSYGPAFEAIRHSLYVWDGDFVEEFVGLKNFRDLLGDLRLWTPLLLGGLFSFIGALTQGAARKRAWRLLAIAFYAWALAAIGRDYWSARTTLPGSSSILWTGTVLLGTALGCGVAGSLAKVRARGLLNFIAYSLPFLFGLYYIVTARRMGDWLFWMSFRLIIILIVANLFKMWPSIFTAVVIHRLKSEKAQYLYRVLFVIPMIIPLMVMLLVWKFFYDPNVGLLNKFLMTTGLDHVLIWLDSNLLHWDVFTSPFRPAWLGQPELVVPALVFWGFPWVGVVGVLIYLAGLQNIPESVYEASELDGITWWGKFRYIELPLIMTQVRLNLILMVIATFQAYGFQLVLLGPTGGPSNKGLTPGLYMFYQAFISQNYGYACAVGIVLFLLILFFTIINQRFVRVDK